jgi:hypothetical protein
MKLLLVSQREPHTDIDPNQVAILIRFVCFNSIFTFIFHLTNFSFWLSFHLNTETKDWHQEFLQIVLRNLLNWCKCVGRNNLNNVLYPLFLCFFNWHTTQPHNHTHTHDNNSTIVFFSSFKCCQDFETICSIFCHKMNCF